MDINETVAFTDILSDAGHNDSRSKFYAGGESSIKESERRKVAEFILDSHKGASWLKVLTLPGIHWQFETLIQREKRKSQFIALEKSRSIYFRSRRHIIGRRKAYKDFGAGLNDRRLLYGSGSVIYSRVCTHYNNPRTTHKSAKSNRLLMMSSDTYATLPITDYGATAEEKQAFFDRFYYRNAIWLDYTSQICKPVEDTIRNLHFCLEADEIEKPVVLTIMNARDCFQGADSRVEHILGLQPLLNYKDHWTYTGKGGTSMLTACFTMV